MTHWCKACGIRLLEEGEGCLCSLEPKDVPPAPKAKRRDLLADEAVERFRPVYREVRHPDGRVIRYPIYANPMRWR